MLNITLDDNLRQKGMAREIVNKVQKLRKAVGLNIDDQVEVFYRVPTSATAAAGSSVVGKVVEDNL